MENLQKLSVSELIAKRDRIERCKARYAMFLIDRGMTDTVRMAEFDKGIREYGAEVVRRALEAENVATLPKHMLEAIKNGQRDTDTVTELMVERNKAVEGLNRFAGHGSQDMEHGLEIYEPRIRRIDAIIDRRALEAEGVNGKSLTARADHIRAA